MSSPLIVFLTLALLILLIVMGVIYIRFIMKNIREAGESDRLRQQNDREIRALSSRLQQMIWEQKEWYADTSELEQAKAELDFNRKATRADEVYRLRFAFPVLLGMAVLAVTYFLPLTSAWGVVGVDVGGAICVICIVWAGVRFWQWRRLARIVAAVRCEYTAHEPQPRRSSSQR